MNQRTYQNTIAVLFALTWGLVLLDRNAITFLFPILMKHFNLNNAQTGQIVMVTGFGFVISSLFLSRLRIPNSVMNRDSSSPQWGPFGAPTRSLGAIPMGALWATQTAS